MTVSGLRTSFSGSGMFFKASTHLDGRKRSLGIHQGTIAKGTVHPLLPLAPFIHLDYFGVCCRVLEIFFPYHSRNSQRLQPCLWIWFNYVTNLKLVKARHGMKLCISQFIFVGWDTDHRGWSTVSCSAAGWVEETHSCGAALLVPCWCGCSITPTMRRVWALKLS